MIYKAKLRWNILKKLRPKGSVLVASIILMLAAGVSALSWVGYVNSAQTSAIRDRERMQAFYAAESGVELIVDFFNNPSHFNGALPSEYTSDLYEHPSIYPLSFPEGYSFLHPSQSGVDYQLFEAYIWSYKTDENGVPLVVNPDSDVDGNPVAQTGEPVPDEFTYFTNKELDTAIARSRTSKIPTCTLDLTANNGLVFYGPKGEELARVSSIQLVNPNDIPDSDFPSGEEIITKIVSTGVTPSGISVTIESLVTEAAILDIRSPGAIVSEASTDYNGNFNVYWGEVWAKDDVLLPSNFYNKVSKYDPNKAFEKSGNQYYDKWFRIRTEKYLKNNAGTEFADVRTDTGFNATAPTSADGEFYTTPFYPGEGVELRKQGKDFTDYENLKQNQDLEFPEYKYEDMKRFVQSGGFGYYFTDASGNIYGIDNDPTSATYGEYIAQTYNEWFEISTTDEIYSDVQEMVYFIDTPPVNDAGEPAPTDANGVPIINNEYYPRDPTTYTTLPTVQVSGQGVHTRGALFIATDLDMTGEGNPTNATEIPDTIGGVLRPDGVSIDNKRDDFNVSHYGLMYSYGQIKDAGNRTIYGSVFAKNGFSGSGDMTVYYNYRLADGSWLDLNISIVERKLWNISD